jgi:hypothetical protein
MTTNIPQGDLPDLYHSSTLKKGVKLKLLQTKIPEPLQKAVMAQMRQDGLTWRQVFRWAALQYLAHKDSNKAEKVWRACV